MPNDVSQLLRVSTIARRVYVSRACLVRVASFYASIEEDLVCTFYSHGDFNYGLIESGLKRIELASGTDWHMVVDERFDRTSPRIDYLDVTRE